MNVEISDDEEAAFHGVAVFKEVELVGGELWESEEFGLKIGFKDSEVDSRVARPKHTQEGEGGRRDGVETRRSSGLTGPVCSQHQ